MSPALDLCSTDPAQHVRTAGQGLHDLNDDLSDLTDVWSNVRQHYDIRTATATRRCFTMTVSSIRYRYQVYVVLERIHHCGRFISV